MQLKFTQTQIDAFIARGTRSLGLEGKRTALAMNYNLEHCRPIMLMKKYLALKALTTWQQDANGNSDNYTNYITQEELNTITSFISKNP